MEATLFWIGCGLGAYGYGLRQLFKRNLIEGRRGLVLLLHLFFTSACGALVGFVLSASMELQGPTPRWPVTGTMIGLAYGFFQAIRARKEQGGTMALLADDLEWVETSFSAIVLAAVIMYTVIQAFKIPSGSMEDTLQIGDHLFVNKFIYGIRVPYSERRVFKLRDVRRRDIVVFEAPSSAILSPFEREHGVKKDFIKRAIGLPGDRIEVIDKRVFVNGQLQDEPFAVYKDPRVYPLSKLPYSPAEYQKFWQDGEFSKYRREQVGDHFGPIVVPPGCYFVMGDNRDGSFDSRFWGPLPNRFLKGKAWVVYMGWGPWPFGFFKGSMAWPFARVKVIR